MNRDAMYEYVGPDTPIDLIAEAWRVLSNPDDGQGKGNISDQAIGYVDDDWSKMARRTLRGFAEANERPDRWPWTNARFDIFTWAKDSAPPPQ